jgi:hypothetical protein
MIGQPSKEIRCRAGRRHITPQPCLNAGFRPAARTTSYREVKINSARLEFGSLVGHALRPANSLKIARAIGITK